MTQGCGHNHNIADIFSRALATEAFYEALAALKQKAEKLWKIWADFRKASAYFEMELRWLPMFTQKSLCVCGFMLMTDTSVIAVLKKSGVFKI